MCPNHYYITPDTEIKKRKSRINKHSSKKQVKNRTKIDSYSIIVSKTYEWLSDCKICKWQKAEKYKKKLLKVSKVFSLTIRFFTLKVDLFSYLRT